MVIKTRGSRLFGRDVVQPEEIESRLIYYPYKLTAGARQSSMKYLSGAEENKVGVDVLGEESEACEGEYIRSGRLSLPHSRAEALPLRVWSE